MLCSVPYIEPHIGYNKLRTCKVDVPWKWTPFLEPEPSCGEFLSTQIFNVLVSVCGGDGETPIPIRNLWESVVNFYTQDSYAHKLVHVSFPLLPSWKVLVLLKVHTLPCPCGEPHVVYSGRPVTPNRPPGKLLRQVYDFWWVHPFLIRIHTFMISVAWQS